MTQKEKQLLLQDLAARLPYEIILLSSNEKITYQTDGNTAAELLVEEGWKPYLRPMSSMTEEEINEFILISDTTLWLGNKRSTCILSLEQMDWLNKKMFDFRGLIPVGLALEAPEGMYKTE